MNIDYSLDNGAILEMICDCVETVQENLSRAPINTVPEMEVLQEATLYIQALQGRSSFLTIHNNRH